MIDYRDWAIKSAALMLALLGLAQIASAATERVVYVDTDGSNGDGSAGSPYSTLNNALSAETKTLVASDRQLTINLRGAADDTTSIDTNLAAFAGNTDATRYLRIIGHPGNATGAHAGVYDSGRYQLIRSADALIDLSSSVSTSRLDWRIENFQIVNTSSGTYRTGLNIDHHPGEFYAIGMIMKGDATTPAGDNPAFKFYSVSSTTKINSVYLINNVIYDWAGNGFIWRSGGTGGKLIAHNNTIYNTGNTGTNEREGAMYVLCQDGSGEVVSIKNNIMQSQTGQAFQKGYTCDTYLTGNNITGDATSPDVSYQSKTVTFTNAGSGDFHQNDSDAVGAGMSLAADTYYAFTTDIDGQTRSGSWDIGADEYQASGPSLLLLKYASEN